MNTYGDGDAQEDLGYKWDGKMIVPDEDMDDHDSTIKAFMESVEHCKQQLEAL